MDKEKMTFAIGAAAFIGLAIGFACKSYIVGAITTPLFGAFPYYYDKRRQKKQNSGE